jgi:thioesterase domain-containing protein
VAFRAMSSAANSALWRLTTKRADSIVPFGGHGHGYPFYCVHSISGDASTLQHLARQLGSARTIYGFQIPARQMTTDFASSVESIAARYVDLITKREPNRPFFLGGWSAGSFIALEMAQILKRQGREVPLLVALDGFQFKTDAAKGQRRYYWNILRNLPHWLKDRIEEGKNGRGLLHSIRRRIGRIAHVLSRDYTQKQGSGIEIFLDTSVWPAAQAAFVRDLFETVERYEAKPYEGRVLVLAAKAQHLFRAGQVEATWRRIAKSVEVVAVDGSHVTMLRESRVLALANRLSERFARLDPQSSENDSAASLATTAVEAAALHQA